MLKLLKDFDLLWLYMNIYVKKIDYTVGCWKDKVSHRNSCDFSKKTKGRKMKPYSRV